MKQRNFGFSLVEMAMVLAISGMMVGYALKADQSSGSKDCYVTTKAQMVTIRTAIEQFARKNDRLPLPALRTLGVENVNYGREASSASTLVSSDYNWGALPFQALGLAPSFAADCWGNKFTYVVTNILTTAGTSSSGNFLDRSAVGKIKLRNATGQISTTTAYAIISHGEDGKGAVKANATTENWCATNTIREDYNCFLGASLMDADFNNGKNAGNNYFDDLIVTSGRPQVKPPPPPAGSALGWGVNGSAQIGDGTTSQRNLPTPVSGGRIYTQISQGGYHTCGITATGAGYCWGQNSNGEGGNGTTTNPSLTPILVTGVTFTSISAGSTQSCGLDGFGTAFCWGLNNQGGVGDGTTTQRTTPVGMLGHSFSQIDSGFAGACAIDTGDALTYCWGYNNFGQLGNGSTLPSSSPVQVQTVPPGVLFNRISVGDTTSCGLTAAGKAYCWGYSVNGQVGDGFNTNRNQATAVANSPIDGALLFTQISAGSVTCGIATNNKTYCWGYNNKGQVGDGSTTDRNTPTIVGGGIIFTKISTGSDFACGLTNGGTAYCWGNNANGQMGNNLAAATYTNPTLVGDNHLYSQISVGQQTAIALAAPNSP